MNSELSRGRPKISRSKCIGCGACERVCPDDAAKVVDGKSTIDLRKCIFCGLCADVCPTKAIEFTHNFKLATTDPDSLLVKSE